MKQEILKGIKKEGPNRLKETLLAKTGLDFENYRNPEVLATIADIMLFPIYAGKAILLPIAFLILCVFGSSIAFIILDKSYLGTFIFFLVSLVFSLPNGVFLGILNFIRQIGHDVRSIISLTLKQAQAIIADIENVKNKAVNKEFELPKISEVLAGVVYIIILPSLLEVVKKRIPRFGRIISAVLSKVIDSVADRMIGISEHSEQMEAEKDSKPSAEERTTGYYKKGIGILQKVDKKASWLTKSSIKVFSLPFILLWIPILAITVLILYLVSLGL